MRKPLSMAKYVLQQAFTKSSNVVLLKGHLFIGELRPYSLKAKTFANKLKGHLFIGELRPISPVHTYPISELKGHLYIGELRLVAIR